MSRLCEFYPGICLTTEEKAQINLSQDKRNFSQDKKNLSEVKKNLSQSTVYIYIYIKEKPQSEYSIYIYIYIYIYVLLNVLFQEFHAEVFSVSVFHSPQQ